MVLRAGKHPSISAKRPLITDLGRRGGEDVMACGSFHIVFLEYEAISGIKQGQM